MSAYLSLDNEIESVFYRNQLYELIKILYNEKDYENIVKVILKFETLSTELIEEIFYKDKYFKVNIELIQKFIDSNIIDSIKEYIVKAYLEDKLKEKLR